MKKKSIPCNAEVELEYVHSLVMRWVYNIFDGMRYASKEAENLLEVIAISDCFADFRAAKETVPLFEQVFKNRKVPAGRLRELLDHLWNITRKIPPSLPAQRIRRLGQILGLDGNDIRILEVLLFSQIPAQQSYSRTFG